MAQKRDFLGFDDLRPGELEALLLRAEELRFLRGTRTPHATRQGSVVALVFEKASTRTRASFEIGVKELGGHALVLGRHDSQLGRGEPIKDTARVLSGYCHAIMIRTFGHEVAQELAAYASVPVINGLTDLLHPCQLLADLQTVLAHFGGPRKVGAGPVDAGAVLAARTYAWVGDGNNMANSWIEAAGTLGLDLAIACPEGYDPDPRLLETVQKRGRGRVTIVRDPKEAVAGRHVVSTDVFASMGQEAEAAERLRAFKGFCVDEDLMRLASPEAIVLHCLPAHRGEEIAEAVFEGPQSLVWRQAENRLHAQKALLEFLLPPS
ncbi:MAG: ornithine carbamoyltransferase [Myxococcales bacterium]|nr:ornithine carbamoyltransferase [Myxococcales bacterium]